MNTTKDDTDDFFENLTRQTDFDEPSLPTSRNHQPYPERASGTCEDDLDDLLDAENLRRPYSWAEWEHQLAYSLYVGEHFTAGLVENRVDNRIGLPFMADESGRYSVYQRECITKELRDSSGELQGVITRSHRGFEVLNTSMMMFVDVDFDADVPAKDQIAAGVNSATAWTANRVADGWNLRLYRTFAGLRLMATHRPYGTPDDDFDALCRAVGADSKFHELCYVQGSFRARLTPKPERCGVIEPECFYPFDNAWEEKYFASWLGVYSTESESYATCRLVSSIGSGVVDEVLQPLLTLHDDTTKVGSRLPLR